MGIRRVSEAFVPLLQPQGGRIVNVTSAAGPMYVSKCTEAKKAFLDDEWNHYRIVAQGNRIRSWVNGVACADFQDDMDSTGFIGLPIS